MTPMSYATTNGQTAAKAKKANPIGGVASWVDDRTGIATATKKQIRKVFPDHWSFLLGEIALWSFVVLLLTGTFLTLWFKPSMAEVSTRLRKTHKGMTGSGTRRPSPPGSSSTVTIASPCANGDLTKMRAVSPAR